MGILPVIAARSCDHTYTKSFGTVGLPCVAYGCRQFLHEVGGSLFVAAYDVLTMIMMSVEMTVAGLIQYEHAYILYFVMLLRSF